MTSPYRLLPSAAPEPGQVFRHVDGGLYRVEAIALDTRDLKPVVVYRHIWPDETFVWVRPFGEWAARFVRLYPDRVAEIMRGDKVAASEGVALARAARKGG